MKQIVDVGTRQIQPKDLSFLSEADFGIIKALGGAVLRMCGYVSSDAVVLDGLEVVISNVPMSPITCKVKAGKVYFNGNMYSVDEREFTLQSVDERNNLVLALNSTAVVADPSPVYDKDLSKTKNAHVEWKGEVSFNQNLQGNAFAFSELNTNYPLLKRIGEFQRKIVPIGD